MTQYIPPSSASRIASSASWAARFGRKPIRVRLEVRFEERFQQQLHRRLDHTVANVGNAQRAFPAIQLRDVHPSHRSGSIRLRLSALRAAPPAARSRPFASISSKVTPSGPGAPAVGFRQRVGVRQDVRPMHLVVEGVRAEVRFVLGSQVQRPLQVPDCVLGFLVSPQSPSLSCRGRVFESGPFPPAAFTAFRGYYGPVRLLARPRRLDCRLGRRVAGATRTARGLPCSTRSGRHVPSLLPRRSASVHRLSTFPRRAAFAHFVEARPPHASLRGYVWVRCALRPVASQPAACQPPACWSRFCWTPRDVTQGTALPYCSAIHRGGLLSSHEERAAFTAHTKSC